MYQTPSSSSHSFYSNKREKHFHQCGLHALTVSGRREKIQEKALTNIGTQGWQSEEIDVGVKEVEEE